MSNNINNLDLLYLTNKEIYNKYIDEKNIEYLNIFNDVIRYRKEIKSKMNKLLNGYLDSSGNIRPLLKGKNDNKKYKNYFYYFLLSLIENIKYNDLKKEISNELIDCVNKSKNVGDDYVTNSIVNIDLSLVEVNNKRDKKVVNLDSFVNVKNKAIKQKILPKKRNNLK
jgi:hypothetical protein